MRISDWSSDVCSSDLWWTGEHHIVLARRLEASRGFDFLFFDDTSTVSNALGGSMDAELKFAVGSPRHEAMPLLPLLAKATQHIGVEIGRASCRERVCQYVSISVVAGSLQKKRNKKIKKYK